MREACGEAHMKTILATGELGSLTNIHKASMVCMMAGKIPQYLQYFSMTKFILCIYIYIYIAYVT